MIYNTEIKKPSKKVYNLASKYINDLELVAFPTETVYGLGANALSDDAVKKIFIAKGRPQDNPLILHVGKKEDIKKYVKCINTIQQKLIDEFMPGPISIVFEKNEKVSDIACAGGKTVAVRLPENKIAQDLINACNCPIVAPSANTSKRPSPTIAQHVYDDMKGKIPLIIDGGETSVGIESTVVKVEDDCIVILRPGKINKDMIEKQIGVKVVEKTVAGKIVEAPGMKYTHYKPNCDMIIVKTNKIETIINLYENYLTQNKKPVIFCINQNIKHYKNKKYVCLGKDSAEASHNLFKLYRKVENKYDVIIAEYVENGDMVEGLFNRMIKSAGGKII